MLLISPTDHQKFILQCRGIIAETLKGQAPDNVFEQIEKLSKDLTELQQLMQTYTDLLSDLSGIMNDYGKLQRKIRVNARRIRNKISAVND